MGHPDFNVFTIPRYAGIVSLNDNCTLEPPVKDYSNILAILKGKTKKVVFYYYTYMKITQPFFLHR